MHKVKESTADMTGAFADGDENAAWRARERQLNAQTQVDKNTPPVALSASTQEAIKAAKEVDLLQAKLRGLKEALEEAEKMLNKRLEVDSHRTVFFEEDGKETLAYEFFCQCGEEYYFVYYDAINGGEVAILNAKNHER